MQIDIGENDSEISKRVNLKKVREIFCLSIYILQRKFWKVETIFLLLACFVILSSLYIIFSYIALINNRDLVLEENKKYPNYYDDELRSEWNFQITKNYDKFILREWNESNSKPSKSIVLQGENGTGFVPDDDERPLMNQLLKENNYNLLASQVIPLRRSLPDLRFQECKELLYPKKLPTTSIIIIFHNEAFTTLLRTLWSIVDRSPHQLIEEIILVDDLSTDKSLKEVLDDYILGIAIRIKIIRTKKREGLIRARLLGSKAAKGDVLTFFDSHMEVTQGWLPPILSRIAADRSVVAIPVIDRIRAADLAYTTYSDFFAINGFRWHLIFTNMSIPQRELIRTRYDRTAPLRTPTHIGCAFSIDREFFYEIGSYDDNMQIWGSENLEMALRVWQCGGAMEIIPCSRVGHLFRISTYSFDGDASKITNRNNIRLVEVWMDEFKHLFYAANPDSKSIHPGDLSERINLRRNLKCKSFRWYLENIFPESTWLEEYYHLGEVVSISDKSCLDIYTSTLKSQLATYGCHNLGGTQFFGFAKTGQIFTVEELCVGVSNDKTVILVKCSKQDITQLWKYDKKNMWILNRESQRCLKNNMPKATLAFCDPNDKQIKWKLSSTS